MTSERDGESLLQSTYKTIRYRYKVAKRFIYHKIGIKWFKRLYYLTKTHPELYLYLDLHCFGLTFFFWNAFHKSLYTVIHSNHMARYHSHDTSDTRTDLANVTNLLIDNIMNSHWKLFGRFLMLVTFSIGYWAGLVPYFRSKLTNPHFCLNQKICSACIEAISIEEGFWRDEVFEILLDEYNGTRALAKLTLMYVGESLVHTKFQDKIETDYIYEVKDNGIDENLMNIGNQLNANNNNNGNNNNNNNNNGEWRPQMTVIQMERVRQQRSRKLKYIIRHWNFLRFTVFIGMTMYSTLQFILLSNKVIKCELKDQRMYYKQIENFHKESNVELYGKPLNEQMQEKGFWKSIFYRKVYSRIISNKEYREIIDETIKSLIEAFWQYVWKPLKFIGNKTKDYGARIIKKMEQYRITGTIIKIVRYPIRVIKIGYRIVVYIPTKMKTHRNRMMTDEEYKIKIQHRAWTTVSITAWGVITLMLYGAMNDEVNIRC